MKETLAVIGTGIAGMAAAWLLKDDYDIQVYEKEDWVGGHTNTVTVDEGGKHVPIDTGFMVYNEATYPLLTRLFARLGVETMETDMSFGIRHNPAALEYSSNGFFGLFAQRWNLVNPGHWKFLREILRFNREAPEVLKDKRGEDISLKEFVSEGRYHQSFVQNYLVPMASAIWSTPPGTMLDIPAVTLVRFFQNHGLLKAKGHLPWRTVKGGSQQYRKKLIASFEDRIFMQRPVTRVVLEKDRVAVIDKDGYREHFDRVLIATHADQALAMRINATTLERRILGAFKYSKNRVMLHTDARVMPRRKDAWASWNYRVDSIDGIDKASTHYWMNRLQKVSRQVNYFVTVNDPGIVNHEKLLRIFTYEHPTFTTTAIRAQKDLEQLNQDGPIVYAGSYFRYGFHEDALMSAVGAVQSLLNREIAI